MPIPSEKSDTPLQSAVQTLRIGKYSIGIGDRFAHQAGAQLRACMLAARDGIDVIPVWNKSNREHMNVGSRPGDVRRAAEAAVYKLGWTRPFYVDADHITLETVDGFLESSDYYTLDVASAIGRLAPADEIDRFLKRHPELLKPVSLPEFDTALHISRTATAQTAGNYLFAVKEAGRIYRRIEAARGKGQFVTEVSMDETDSPQSPSELLVILAALADEQVPLQAIAPKFTGRFNKGVDYVGDAARFEAEFRSDIAVIGHAVRCYHLPGNLKLSVHSGSDKFSLYPAICRALRDFDIGVHVKTAGTTWLEEVIGLAEAGGGGLEMAKEIYAQAYARREELCAPYAAVIDIDATRLPFPQQVNSWSSAQFTAALRHDRKCPDFNPHLRQMLHVAYKTAASLGDRYLRMLDACEDTIARNVTANLYERHLRLLFPGR
ncbi:MAG: tagaturonate epimerase family protein [Acidobacteriia bacterium]|nr:tagaturonate epimerase family protein [Terriglobia bacterium]